MPSDFMQACCLEPAAVPRYGAGGELIDGGGDLAMGGVTAYYFDAIYIAVFVQFSTVLSSKFWLVFLVVSLGQFHFACLSINPNRTVLVVQ